MLIRYFAWLKDHTGCAQEEIALPEEVQTVDDLIGYLSARNISYAKAFADRKTVRAAVNHEFANPSQHIKNDDEVAFFPPVTGG